MHAHTVWIVTSTALVLLMTPGLALFYGGLVRSRSVLNMMMLSLGSMGLIAVLWVLYGANMSVVGDAGPLAFAGNPLSNFGQAGVAGADLVGVAFGATFAIISTALISGAIADRTKFGAWMLFAGLWATLVYFPVAAWVWGGGWVQSLGGWLGTAEVIDWAGGTAVHLNAGAAALALALVLGRRVDFASRSHRPHNIPLVLLGGSLLWFGWFGFNAGLAADDDQVGLIVINTLVAPAAGILGWLFTERLRGRKPTSIGAISGVVAGLVAITPACADLTPGWSIVLGLIAGSVCALAIDLKYRLGYDDSLDVVGLHLVAGVLGTLFLGFAATDTGLFATGDWGLLLVQLISVLGVGGYSFLVSLVLALLISKTIGFRVAPGDELAGVDRSGHGEDAYELDAPRAEEYSVAETGFSSVVPARARELRALARKN